MNELKVKMEIEKKFVVPPLCRTDGSSDEKHCIVNDKFAYINCGGILCEECICNIDNFIMMANSHNLQLL